MNNVPSSAILAIVAIVAACLLGAFIFITVQSHQAADGQTSRQTSTITTQLDESQFTQYDGEELTGRQVKAVIHSMKGQELAAIIDNTSGNGYTEKVCYYDLSGNSASGYVLGAARDDAGMNAEINELVENTSVYTAAVIRDQQNGSLIALRFVEAAAKDQFAETSSKPGYVSAGTGDAYKKVGGVRPKEPGQTPEDGTQYVNKLIYDANGGTGAPKSTSINVFYPDTDTAITISSKIPVKDGYYFNGWYTRPAGGDKVEGSVKSGSPNTGKDQTVTVYAHWTVDELGLAEFQDFLWANKPESVIFTNSGADSGADVSAEQDGHILAWMSGTTMYVSQKEPGKYVRAPKSLSDMFCYNSSTSYPADYVKSIDLTYLDTGKVTNMKDMFYGCSNLVKLEISHLNTANVKNMSGMFHGCQSLTTLDVSKFNTKNVTTMYDMFCNCQSLTALDTSRFDTRNVTTIESMFNGCSSLAVLDVSGFNTANIKNMDSAFSGCCNLTVLDVSGFDTGNVTDMNCMFCNCNKVTMLDVSGFDTSKVKSMASMFRGCQSLTTLDVSGFDTGAATTMYYTFAECSSLTMLDVSGFDTSKVTSMSHTFYGCQNLTTLDVSGFNTSNVSKMYGMFAGCKSLTTIDVSGFDTSKVKEINGMFCDCQSLTALDTSGFDTQNVTTMESMFNRCISLKALDVSGFNTANVTNMDSVFSDCRNLNSLDVSGFNTEKVTDMNCMFCRCSGLTSIDISGFDVSNVINMNGMFTGCSGLVTLTIPATNGNGISNTTSKIYGQSVDVSFPISASGRTVTLK